MKTQNADPRQLSGRRNRWLVRILGAIALISIALGAAWLTWDIAAKRRLANAISHYRGLGQPVTVSDFALPRVSESENAAPGLLATGAASKRLQRTLQIQTWKMPLEDYPFCESGVPSLAPLEPILAQVDVAMSRPKTDWHHRFQTPVLDHMTPSRPELRDLAEAMSLASQIYARQHKLPKSLRLIEQLDALGHRLAQPQPMIVSALACISVQSKAVGALSEIMVDIDLTDPSNRAAAERLKQQFLDESTGRKMWDDAVLAERLLVVDATTEYLINDGNAFAAISGMRGTASFDRIAKALSPLLDPAWRMEGARQLDWFEALRKSFEASSFPAGASLIPPTPVLSGIDRVLRWPTGILAEDFGKCLELRWRTVGRRRMAATALAIRQYEADHGGWPFELADLTPDYLTAVPTDPFDGAGRGLRYEPTADFPSLGVVGPDGVPNTEDDRRFPLRGMPPPSADGG